MWSANNTDLKMCEGDWGIALPCTFKGITFSISDSLKFVFKAAQNGETILEKEYTPNQSTVNLVFTEADSALLPQGNYVYLVDWYQSGAFLCNLIPSGVFKVVDKA